MLNIPLHLRLSRVARATVPDRQSHLNNYCDVQMMGKVHKSDGYVETVGWVGNKVFVVKDSFCSHINKEMI